MKTLLSQQIIIPGSSPIEGPIPTLVDDPGVYKFNNLGEIITVLLQYLYPLAGIILFIFIIASGFQWLTATGDPKKIESARQRLTYAILGFILLVASPWVARIVQLIFSPNEPFF